MLMHLTHNKGTALGEFKALVVTVDKEGDLVLGAEAGDVKVAAFFCFAENYGDPETLELDEDVPEFSPLSAAMRLNLPEHSREDVKEILNGLECDVICAVKNGAKIIELDLPHLVDKVSRQVSDDVEATLEEAKELVEFIGERIVHWQKFSGHDRVENLRLLRRSLLNAIEDKNHEKLKKRVASIGETMDEHENE